MTGQLERHPGSGLPAGGSERDRLLAQLLGADVSRFPTSYAQRRQWVLQEQSPHSTAYVMPWGVRLSGPVDLPALQRALDAVVARHEALRTCFDPSSGGTVQLVDTRARVRVEQRMVDGDIDRVAAELPTVAFDLARGPLLRVGLWSVRPADPTDDPTEHLLTVAVHHAVADGASVDILLRDLSQAYRETRTGRCPILGDPLTQPADHAVWEAAEVVADGFDTDLAHWIAELAGRSDVRTLPTDRPGLDAVTGPLGRVERPVDRRRTTGVERLAADLGTTPFAVLLTAYWITMSRYAGRHDLVIGVPASGRTRPEIAETVGLFVNTLPVRLRRRGARTGAQLVTTVHRTLARALAHQRVPLDLLVQRLAEDAYGMGIDRGNAAFDTVFTSHDEPDVTGLLDSAQAVPVDLRPGHTKADLTCVPVRRGAQLEVQWDFRVDRYDERTVLALASTFDLVLDRLVEHHDADAEADGLASTPTSATDDTDVTRDLLGIFAEVVEARPDDDAVVDHETTVSYRELDRRSNRLAHHLRSLGVRDEAAVGICLPRSADLAVACLAVLKAGGSYLPIDPAYPAERVGLMLEDSRVSLVIGALDPVRPDPTTRVVDVAEGREDLADAPPDVHRHAQSLGVRIYTSGSTGRPKAVGVTLDGIVRLVHPGTYGGFGRDRRVLWIAAVSFDVSTWEIWGTLLHGATGVVSGPREYDAEVVRATIRRHGVTTALFSTALFNAIVDADPTAFAGLSDLLIGGEALSVAHVRAVADALPEVRLANAYGPAEITTIATCRTVVAADLSGPSVPIGAPVAGTRTVVAGPDGRGVSPGATGELWLSGDGLARGYLNQPSLTAERFVPASGGGRWYRSGDLAKEVTPGELVFLGRTDRQVKVRGHRVEPGELESLLVARPEVARAAVIATPAPGGSHHLVAFVVPVADGLGDLHGELSRSVPSYLVPAAIHAVAQLPTTVNGKVDLAALDLRSRHLVPVDRPVAAIAPRGPVERIVADVCQEVLALPAPGPGRDDDFFTLGGNSLLAATFVARLHERTGTRVPLVTVFDHPVLSDLAAFIDTSGGRGTDPGPAPSAPRPAPLSAAQQRLFFLEQLDPGSSVFNIPLVAEINGELDTDALSGAVRTVVLRHEVLSSRIDPDGPEPRQVVVPEQDVPALRIADLADDLDPALAARELVAAEVRRPFDLSGGDLPIRALLVKVAPQQHLICLVLHHIVADGWSVGVLSADLGTAYADLRAGRTSTLPPLSVQYVDLAHAERLAAAAGTLAPQLEHWTDRLRGAPQTVDLPVGRPRPARRRQRGAWHRFSVDAPVRDAVDRLARDTGGTPFMVLLASFAGVLADASGQDEVLVGTPVANRTRAGADTLIGLFANTLALRIDTAGNPTGRGLVERVTRVALDAFSHPDAPYEMVVEELAERRDLSRTPLVQVMFSLDNTPRTAPRLEGTEVRVVDVDNPAARCDLTVAVRSNAAGLEGLCEYDADLFTPDEVSDLVTRFVTVLSRITATPEDQLVNLRSEAPARLCGPPRGVIPDLWRAVQDRATVAPEDVVVTEPDGTAWTARALVEAVRLRAHATSTAVSTPSDVDADLIVSVLATWVAAVPPPAVPPAPEGCAVTTHEATGQSYAGVVTRTDWWTPGESVGVIVGHPDCVPVVSLVGPIAAGCRLTLIDPERPATDELPQTVMGGPGITAILRAGWSPPAGGLLVVPVEVAAEVDALLSDGAGRPRVEVVLRLPGLEYVAAGPDPRGLVPRLDRTLLPGGWLGVVRSADGVTGPARIGALAVHDGSRLHRTGTSAFVGPDGALRIRTGPDPRSERARRPQTRGRRAPTGPTELAVAQIWSALLPTEGEPVVVRDADADFFSLGGQSFLAARLASRLARTFGLPVSLHDVFDNPSVAAQAALVGRAVRPVDPDSAPGPAEPARPDAPLTPAQERLWFLHQLAPQSPAYNIPLVAMVDGAVDTAALERAARWVLERHEALRIAVVTTSAGLRQTVRPVGTVDVVERLTDAETERAALSGASVAVWRPFDLTAGDTPVRFAAGRVGTGAFVVAVTVHHLVADGWAVGVILSDLCVAYAAFVAGAEPAVAALATRWSDWATSSRVAADAEVAAAEVTHWRRVLDGAPRTLDLPAAHPRPEVRRHRGHSLPVVVPRDLTRDVRALAVDTGCTDFMVLQAAFATTLSRFAGGPDVLVGAPVAGRYDPEEENLVGLLANTVVLRTDLRTVSTVRDLLATSRRTCLDAFEHQSVPFERIVEQIGGERDPSRSPVFQVMFAFNDVPQARLDLPGLVVRPVEPDNPTAKFDVVLNLADHDDRIVGVCEYDADVYDAPMVQRLVEHLVRTLSAFVADPDATVAALDLLDPHERRELVVDFNRTPASYRPDRTLTRLVEDAVDRWPARIAVTEASTGRELTYVQLDRAANALAGVLVEAGAPGTVVAVHAARSLDLVIAELAILKAGSAFLPLDPDWPDGRRHQILIDAGCTLVVHSGARPQLPDGVGAVPVHAARIGPAARSRCGVPTSPQQPAYVVYTSGSTGRPKGVVVPHAGIVNNLLWMQQDWPLGNDDRMLHKTASTFDVSVKEIFWPLLAGARLVLADPGSERDPEAILRQLDEHGVTITHLVPSVLDLVLDAAERQDRMVGRSLRLVMCGAETLSVGTQQRYARRCAAELLHMYGPTETSVAVTGWACAAGTQLDRPRVPLGRPMPHSSLYVLDDGLVPTPRGVEGELHVGGTPLAQGYLRRPAETAAAFVPDPFSAVPGSRMYRTGDRVRLTADELLEFAGRRDNQVKVRGHRVELGEVEAALRARVDVRQAAVVAIGTHQSDTHLVAYVVVDPESGRYGEQAPVSGVDPEVDPTGERGRAMRQALGETLPRAFVPSRVVVVDRLPLTVNGKVDRDALRQLGPAVHPGGSSYVAPRNELETTVAGVWAQVLDLDRVGVEDDFFELGGHSLQAVAVASRLQEVCGVQIALRDILATPTVARVADLLRSARVTAPPVRIPSRRHRRPASAVRADDVRSTP